MSNNNKKPVLLYLWKKRTLYLGKLPTILDLTPGASTLLIGLEKPFPIYDYKTGKIMVTQSALIPAGVRFRAETGGQHMANCYLDPFGHDLQQLSKLMQNKLGAIMTNCATESDLLSIFLGIIENVTPPAIAYKQLTEQVLAATSYDAAPVCNEMRIIKAIELIQNNPLSNDPTESLAIQSGLTPPQLNRWFKRITGVPVRRYRLWHRLFVTATLMGSGNSSITDAAHEAGFSDSSHLNHTFRSMLGMTPSFLFQQSNQLRILTSEEE